MADLCENKRNGQCPNRAMTGKRYCNSCEITIGTSTVAGRLRAYKLGRWQSRLDELSDASVTRSLTEEIGVARMTLEMVINSCSDEKEILMNSHRIGDLVTRIEKLVASCHRLEKSTGMLLDKSSVLQIAGNIISIIQRHIKDPEVIESIAQEILEVISNVDSSDNEDKDHA